MIGMLGTASDRAVAAALGINHSSVFLKRRSLGISPYREPISPGGPRFEWTDRAIRLLGKGSDRKIARKLGISPSAVFHKRRVLGIPGYRPPPKRLRWTQEMLALLGRVPDRVVARRFGTTKDTVGWKREELGRPSSPYRPAKKIARTFGLRQVLKLPNRQLRERYGISRGTAAKLRAEFGMPTPDGRNLRWSREVIARLGKESDYSLAGALGVTQGAIWWKRRLLGISPYEVKHQWTAAERALLGKIPDREVARRVGVSLGAVRTQRRALGGRMKGSRGGPRKARKRG